MHIIIADDHDLVRDALCELIRRDDPAGEVIPAASLGQASAILQSRQDIDLVLLDLYMPGMNGLAGALEVTTQYPGVKTVLMSGMAADNDVIAAMRGGVRGFIPKTLPGASLTAALRLIASGEAYFPAELLLRGRQTRTVLTEREEQIASQLRLGATNKVIAQRLGLDEMTVKGALRTMGAKLGARTRTEIALKSLQTPGSNGADGGEA